MHVVGSVRPRSTGLIQLIPINLLGHIYLNNCLHHDDNDDDDDGVSRRNDV